MIELIKSISKNLYRKYYLSKISYRETQKALRRTLKLSVLEVRDMEREFDQLFTTQSFSIGGPQAVLKDDAFALYAIVRRLQPSYMVETGTYQGYSSHVIIEAIKKNQKGRFITCDIEDYRVFKDDFNEKSFEFAMGPSSESFKLIAFEQVDIFFHDSDHRYPNVLFEISTAVKNKVKIILCHDFAKKNVHNTVKVVNGKGCRHAFIEAVGEEYQIYELPTINGIGMAVKKPEI